MFVTERFHLSEEVKQNLQRLPVQWGFGEFSRAVYFRTYSRQREDGSQEQWADTVIRVVEGVISIRKDWYKKMGVPWNESKWSGIAQRMADAIFHMRFLPPGRGLWAMGTDYIFERGSAALNNCAYVDITNNLPAAASWSMDMLMCGVGVGFGTQNGVSLLPSQRQQETYQIPDTREGWAESLRRLLENPLTEFDYSQVRPAGTLIKGFGGIASGPEPLQLLHQRVKKYQHQFETGWDRTRFIADVFNAVGACVVAGNVRRSAELATGSSHDSTFLNLKNYEMNPERQEIGWMSNNSVVLSEPDDFLYLPDIAERIRDNGEPGVINLMNVQKYGRFKEKKADAAVGFNPCAEIPLESYELCNLVEVFPTRCQTYQEIYDAMWLATIYASTVALLPSHRTETNAVVARNRRIGVSISGIADWLDASNVANLTTVLRWGYEQIVEPTNRQLAAEAGVPASVRLTTVKPSGCWRHDSLISTDLGFLRFDELVNTDFEGWQTPFGGSVHTRSGTREISKYFNNGIAETKRVTTADGFEIEVTKQHPMLVDQGGELNWVKAQDLQVGDRLVARLGQYTNAEESNLIGSDVEADGRCQGFTGPMEMSPDLAWFLGLFHGNGSVHKKGIRIAYNKVQDSLVPWLMSFAQSTFGITPTVDSGENSRGSINFNSVHLLEWLQMNGLLKDYASDIEVPYPIRSASAESIKAFLAGFWRADGGQHNSSNWSVCTTSKKFVQELAVLSRGVGINVKITPAGPGEWGSKDRWVMTNRVMKPENLRYVSRDLRNRIISEDLWADPVVNIEDGECLTLDVEVPEVHEYTAQGFVSHNTISQLAGVSPGMHWPVHRYYIRRMRVSENSPVTDRLIAAGVPHEPDVYSDNTLVFEFPQSAGKGQTRSVSDVSIWEQAAMVAFLQREWADNAVSNTLTFRKDEERDVEKVLSMYAPQIKSMSMLPESEDVYEQLPYQRITRDEYRERLSKINEVDWQTFSGSDGQDSRFCENDVCEVSFVTGD